MIVTVSYVIPHEQLLRIIAARCEAKQLSLPRTLGEFRQHASDAIKWQTTCSMSEMPHMRSEGIAMLKRLQRSALKGGWSQ